ncbi:hypothetical protein EBU99_13790 [bacterium]|nr:hypothetical protein [bacterium]
MDTRLLRVWSNCKPAWLFAARILQVFFLSTLCPSLAVLAAQSEGEPRAAVSLVWNPQTQTFYGTQFVALPPQTLTGQTRQLNSDHKSAFNSAAEFWLMPNRDLEASTQLNLSREQREFRTSVADVEWPFSELGLGALLVKQTQTAESAKPCPDDFQQIQNQSQILSWEVVSFERADQERVLKIPTQVSAKAQCLFLKIDFVFQPHVGEGNFSITSSGKAVFSGPIFPVFRNQPLATRMLVRDTKPQWLVHCLSCTTLADGSVETDFLGLPPVLQLRKNQTARAPRAWPEQPLTIDRLELKTKRPDRPGEISETLVILQAALGQALDLFENAGGRPWRVELQENALLEQLIVEQVSEIQLHPSFGQVSPLLNSYHRAALFRALARSIARNMLTSQRRLPSWEDMREDEVVSRILAEIWLRQSFQKLTWLKKISDDLAFLPFFRAVQQGNAFINNSVFVGAEERLGMLDFSTLHEFFAPLQGAELVDRIVACLSSTDAKALENIAGEVGRGEKAIGEFSKFLREARPNETCQTPMKFGVLPNWLPEEQIEVIEGRRRIKVERSVIAPPQTHRFLFPNNIELPREPLNLQVVNATGEIGKASFAALTKSSQSAELAQSVVEARVLPPHRAVAAERLIWPRPLRTVLQALSLNYDSRRSDLLLRSQIQTTQTGDPWLRALTLGFRREFAENNVDFQFSSRIPSLLPETNTTITLGISSRFVKVPPTFLAVSYGVEKGAGSYLYPDGLGFRLWLRRPLSLSALNSVMPDPNQEWIVNMAAALAPRLTWCEFFSYGLSDVGVDVGLRSVPGWPAREFVTREYAWLRSEVRQTLTQNLNVSIARSILFQHSVLYAAHVVAFDDVQAARQGSVDARVAQSLVSGVRFLGALFGAKDQAFGLEVARALTDPARTSIGITLGRVTN